MKSLKWFNLFFLLWASSLFAETINVGLEPFPPLITEDKKGYSIDMLKEIEKISDLKFNIQIMSYGRAKVELKKKHLDLIGHTPYQLEEPEFYQYAEELDWNMSSDAVLFVHDKKYFNLSLLQKYKIGTPLGNTGFHALVLGVPKEKFSEGRLENLVAMLKLKRIDALIFARASTMSIIQQQKVPQIYYKSYILIPTGFAVYKDNKGLKLKKNLNDLIRQVNQEKTFKNFIRYMKMPNTGIVPIK